MEKIQLPLTKKQLDMLEEVLSAEIERTEDGGLGPDDEQSQLNQYISDVADIRTEIRELIDAIK